MIELTDEGGETGFVGETFGQHSVNILGPCEELVMG